MSAPQCRHMGSVSKSRNVNRGGYSACIDCDAYLGGVFFADGPARDVDTLDEAIQLGIAP